MIYKDDYQEQCCCNNEKASVVPVFRIKEKLDKLYIDKSYDEVSALLKRWEDEALFLGDKRALLFIYNEQIGLYRKIHKEANSLTNANKALLLCEELGLLNSYSFGTTLINAATAYNEFGRLDQAMTLYERARELFELELKIDDEDQLLCLYNNMAVCFIKRKEYDKAEICFGKIIAFKQARSENKLYDAISYCNIADLVYLKSNGRDLERAKLCLELAYKILKDEALFNESDYSFTCEKCIDSFSKYGLKELAKDLDDRK